MREEKPTRWLLRLLVGLLTYAGGLGLLSTVAVGEELSPEPRDQLHHLKTSADQVWALAQQMPENARRLLSSGAQNLIHLSQNWEKVAPKLRQASPEQRSRSAVPSILAPKRVSDPNTDVAFSALGGFTQSETSVARCGNTAVVGWNDSGSVLETFFGGPGGSSFNGVGRSTNANNANPTFTDLGFLNPGADPEDSLRGDPVVACTNANTFYYASLFFDNDAPVQSCISVSASTNGGQSFSAPRTAVCKGIGPTFPELHFLDNPTTLFDLALDLSPLSMRKISAVIALLQPGDELEDVFHAVRLQG